MEEEYRMQKAQGDIQQALGSAGSLPGNESMESDAGQAVIHEDGTVAPASDDAASTRAMMAPPSPPLQATASGELEVQPSAAIPTIRISTESLRAESEATKVNSEASTKKGKGRETSDDEGSDDEHAKDDEDEEDGEAQVIVHNGPNGSTQANGVNVHALEKPVQAAGEGEQNVNEASPAPVQEPFSFSTKRLCERWLDNLFMVLYEVSRVC